jgi:hypothetical protein
MRAAGIGFRMITGGSFLRHEAARFFDYTTVGQMAKADIAHDHGFFVGNHPRDLTAEITRLREVLDIAAQPVDPAAQHGAGGTEPAVLQASKPAASRGSR